MKPILKEIGFKYSNKQFINAESKRLNNNINLNKYKRHIPKSKRKLNSIKINNILTYLNQYSKQTSCIHDKIRYLEYTKIYL